MGEFQPGVLSACCATKGDATFAKKTKKNKKNPFVQKIEVPEPCPLKSLCPPTPYCNLNGTPANYMIVHKECSNKIFTKGSKTNVQDKETKIIGIMKHLFSFHANIASLSLSPSL